MVVKVKKNKMPKKSKGKSKGRHASSGVVKQAVSQNVKVNIFKEPLKGRRSAFKVATQNKGAVPNIKELPQSVFHQPVFQPKLTLYNETFGDSTRQLRTNPFESQLASLAVQDNRALEVATLRNSLESSRLKAVEREPIQASFRGETEEQHFMNRARASMQDNREPFRVVDRNDATTLEVSRKDRLTEADKLDMAEKRRLRFQAPPNAITNSLARADEELETGQANTGEGESQTFRSHRSQAADEYTVIDTNQAVGEHSGLPLGEPSIPNRLVSFVEQTGTAGDFLREQRGEYTPMTEGEIQAKEFEIEGGRKSKVIIKSKSVETLEKPEKSEERRPRGRTPSRIDEKAIKAREAVARSRARAKSVENAPALKARGRPKKGLVEGMDTP